MKNKIVTLFGGSGQIGSNLIGSLIKKNFRCIVVTRSAYNNIHLKTQATPGAIELLEWNAENFSEIGEAIKNSDIVINLVGILYETRKQKFNKLHAKLPEAIAKICARSNVEKLIQISAIGSSINSRSLYQKSKFQGEVNALNNFKNTVIVRPSIVESPTSNFSNLFGKLSFFPIIPIPNLRYRIQPILCTDVVKAIMNIIEVKDNFGKIYEIGGPKILSFKEMIQSIMKAIGKKRLIVEMPMPLAKIQSTITDLLPFPPILTRDQCEILSEQDNVVSNNHLTLKDLDIKPSDVEKAMIKWLVRFRDQGQFSLGKNNEKS
tara:strand:- start:246 stop:1205 length:960 start_codon:yes stop_codon:yes gene_type:complete